MTEWVWLPFCKVTTTQTVSGLPGSFLGPFELGTLVRVFAGHPRAQGDMEDG